MKRCPCCNARLNEAIDCPRCKAELGEIAQVHRLAKFWRQKAIVFYLNNKMSCCVDALTRSLQLQHSDSTDLFRAFVIQQQDQTLWVRLPSLIKNAQSRITSVTSVVASSLMNLILLAKQYRLKKRESPRSSSVTTFYSDKTNNIQS